jgi:hypothetical protein
LLWVALVEDRTVRGIGGEEATADVTPSHINRTLRLKIADFKGEERYGCVVVEKLN